MSQNRQSVQHPDYKNKVPGIMVTFTARARDLSLFHGIHTDSGAHPASYTKNTEGSFPGGKVAGT
jgi:hypothetical protein